MEDFDVMDPQRKNHAMLYVDKSGHPGLVVRHKDGKPTSLSQQDNGEWISLTYQPHAKGNEIITNVKTKDDLELFVEPVGKQLYFVNTK
jgi:hypothetical protein